MSNGLYQMKFYNHNDCSTKRVYILICYLMKYVLNDLSSTRLGRETHICVSQIISLGSDNVLSPSRLQAIIWTDSARLLIGPLGINIIFARKDSLFAHWDIVSIATQSVKCKSERTLIEGRIFSLDMRSSFNLKYSILKGLHQFEICKYWILNFHVITTSWINPLNETIPVNMTEMGLKWPNAFLPFSHTWPGYGLPLCLEGAIW